MRRWGPYVAAIYEPLPIMTFLQNVFAALNPYNWFTSANPDYSIISTTEKNEDQDVVVLVHETDNAIPVDDRNSVNDRIEMKMEHENFYDSKVCTYRC